MLPHVAQLRLATWPAALAVLFATLGSAAHADTKLTVHYSVSVAGLAIGKTDLEVMIGSAEYTSTATGRASGSMRVAAASKRADAPWSLYWEKHRGSPGR